MVERDKSYMKDIEPWSIRYLDKQWADRGLPAQVFRKYFWAAENLCESPIECRMLAGLMMCPFGYYEDLNVIISHDDAVAGQFKYGGDNAIIIPQAKIRSGNGNYRVDFLVVLNARHVQVSPAPSFIVECDGHDFHERTKEQAARDKKRDRAIQELGVPIFRFTGSEIHRDLDACINQLDGYAARVLSKLWGG